MERWRALIPVAIALVVAVVASALIYNWMKKQTARQCLDLQLDEKKDSS